MENMVWDHPGGSRGRLGDQFGPKTAQCSKNAPKNHEILVRFRHQNGDPTPLKLMTFTTLSALFPKAQSFQNRAKTEAKKSHAGHTTKTVLGAVGPLKNNKTGHQNTRTSGSNTP